MNKKLALALSGLALATLAAGATARAGAKVGGQVTVNTAARWAQGGMGYARSTSDATVALGCQVQVIALGVPSMNCFARDLAGNTITCYSDDPNLMSIMGAINSDSYVHFEWDENNSCTTIYIATHSAYQPKQP
jgi:hypothetical protein